MDGGDHWTTSSRGLEQITVTALAMHPAKKDVVYAGTKYHGVYRSVDGGRTWQADGDGLGPVSVNALTITADGRWLLAATARGSFSEDRAIMSKLFQDSPGCRTPGMKQRARCDRSELFGILKQTYRAGRRAATSLAVC